MQRRKGFALPLPGESSHLENGVVEGLRGLERGGRQGGKDGVSCQRDKSVPA